MHNKDFKFDLKERKKYQNQAPEYTCSNCANDFVAPKHCGHPMYIEKKDEGLFWTCWMGAGCGEKAFEAKCDAPELVPK